MESLLLKLKEELKTQLASGLQGRRLQVLTDKAIKIATLESLILKNIRAKQLFEVDALLLESILNKARAHRGRVMLVELEELGTLPALRRAIALGTSRGLLTKYNDSEHALHEELRIVGQEVSADLDEWHYYRRLRVIENNPIPA